MQFILLFLFVVGFLDNTSCAATHMHSLQLKPFPNKVNTKFSDQSSLLTPRFPIRLRNIRFWSGVVRIYSSYKVFQVKLFLIHVFQRYVLQKKADIHLEIEERKWKELHERNSKRMLNLCLSLRGFYLKTGQFLATRHDFMPSEYTSKLSKLQDDVPPMDEQEVRCIIEEELELLQRRGILPIVGNHTVSDHGLIDHYFDALELKTPIGSASVAQVHRGKLSTACGNYGPLDVAVKVQNPQALVLMTKDLRNLKVLARFLRRSGELNFDILSAVNELSKQVHAEFDFQREAFHLDYFGKLLRSHRKQLQQHSKFLKLQVSVPESVFSSRRMLVMSFLPGRSLTQLARMKDADSEKKVSSSLKSWFQKHAMREIVHTLGEAWAIMLFAPRPPSNCLSTRAEADRRGSVDTSKADNDDEDDETDEKRPPLSKQFRFFKRSKVTDRETVPGSTDRVDSKASSSPSSWEAGVFHADPHPGNLLLHIPAQANPNDTYSSMKNNNVLGILDWGQVKRMKPHRLALLAELVLAIDQYHRKDHKDAAKEHLVQTFLRLGIRVAKPQDTETVSRMALTMFDTAQAEKALVADPFSKDSGLRKNGLHKLPSDLFFVLRSVQILRGFAAALDRAAGKETGDFRRWSLAQQWAPYARSFLQRYREQTARADQ